MSKAKSLGQIAHEATSSLRSGRLTFADPLPWAKVPRWMQDEYEVSARAVAKAVAEECAQIVVSVANADAGNPYKQALRLGAESIRAKFGISGSTQGDV